MKKKYIYYILLVLGIALTFFWMNQQGGGKIQSPVNNNGDLLEVKGIVAVKQDFANIITVSGSIEANEQVQIRSEVSGLVETLSFQEGSTVQKGQALLQIDDSELQARLAQAQTREKLSMDNERRANLLLEKEAISQQEYDVAYADYKTAQAEIQLIQAQLGKTQIKAPFSGKIGLRSISAGEYLTPNTVVANLISNNPIKILFSIPEKYSGDVRQDQDITFSLAGYSNVYHASVYAVEPAIDANTRTIQLKAKAENEKGEIIPGSFARIELPIQKRENVILIPTQAIIPIQNGKQVFVYKDGKATVKNIQTEDRTGEDAIVTSGLQPGDTVLTTGIMSLKEGMPIKVALTKEDEK